MRHCLKLVFAGFACVSVMGIGAPLASAYDMEAEIGRPLSTLNEKSATELLTSYAEGKILAYAPKPPRLEFLEAIIKASPEGSNTRMRAELLLQSARTSHWPDN